eukprot:GHVR01164449.1.p1 GENE.GHVR01164449.1~~GHVR01164449.1.p1  ORF type:complete len:184 (+),score=54.35 GHVR01164449.1:92-643(+)
MSTGNGFTTHMIFHDTYDFLDNLSEATHTIETTLSEKIIPSVNRVFVVADDRVNKLEVYNNIIKNDIEEQLNKLKHVERLLLDVQSDVDDTCKQQRKRDVNTINKLNYINSKLIKMSQIVSTSKEELASTTAANGKLKAQVEHALKILTTLQAAGITCQDIISAWEGYDTHTHTHTHRYSKDG